MTKTIGFFPGTPREFGPFEPMEWPSPDDWSDWKNPSNGSNRDWMLCAELTHGHTAELIDAAKSASLRAAYVFYDAIPYKMTAFIRQSA